jgi:serine/threonine protein phosphatase PrpC
MRLLVRAATDPGLRREHNEDAFAWWLPDPGAGGGPPGVLLMVADGMGGARAGEVASRLATETLLRVWPASDGNDPIDSLREAVAEANRDIHRESLAHPEQHGMGTTVTALTLLGDRACLAHVGDSRAYLVRGGTIRQLTLDHSLVAQLVRDHHLTEEQARIDPRRNVVTRSVGVSPEVEIDAFAAPEPLEPGDTLLLCTDGLHTLVRDDELERAAAAEDLAGACRALIAMARERGGPDNITVLLARLQSGDGVHAESVSGA